MYTSVCFLDIIRNLFLKMCNFFFFYSKNFLVYEKVKNYKADEFSYLHGEP